MESKGIFRSTAKAKHTRTTALITLSSLREQLQDEEEQVQHIQVQVDRGQDVFVVACSNSKSGRKRYESGAGGAQPTPLTELGAEEPRVVDNVQGEDDRAEQRVAGIDNNSKCECVSACRSNGLRRQKWHPHDASGESRERVDNAPDDQDPQAGKQSGAQKAEVDLALESEERQAHEHGHRDSERLHDQSLLQIKNQRDE